MHAIFMERAITLSLDNIKNKQGGPFGAIIVQNNTIIAEGVNTVTSTYDPTAHAEIAAIRSACAKLQTIKLAGCTLHSSCEPCPMCLGAIYWAHLDAIFYGATREDAAAAQFDDSFIYEQIKLPHALRAIPAIQQEHKRAQEVFVAWAESTTKIPY